MLSTYILMFLVVASGQVQTMTGFTDRDSCVEVQKQIDREFKPHKSACIEIRQKVQQTGK